MITPAKPINRFSTPPPVKMKTTLATMIPISAPNRIGPKRVRSDFVV